MLRERADLWNFGINNLKEHLVQERDRILEERPRWKTIKGKKVPVFHASEANACERRLTYAYRGDLPLPVDIDGALRLHDGDPHADSIVHWLETMGYTITDREKWLRRLVKTPEGPIAVSGHIDGIIEIPSRMSAQDSPRVSAVLEIKGLSTHTMRRDMMSIVNKTYRFQAQAYMWMSKVYRTVFAIKDKNNSQFRLFEMDYNPKVIRQLLWKWARVLRAVGKGELLDRQYAQDSLECKWCRHNHTCWGK